MASARKKLLFALVTNAFLLIALEGAARLVGTRPPDTSATIEFVGNDLAGRFPTRPDPDLFWSIPPGAAIPDTTEVANSHGFRGPDFPARRPDGTVRILCIGDSNTFGIGVFRELTFSHRLSRWAAGGKGGKIEVLNCGVPGFSSFQMLQLIRTRALNWQPDVVIVYAGAWNDYTPAIGAGDVKLHSFIQSTRSGSLLRLEIIRMFGSFMGGASVERAASRRSEYIRLWSDDAKRPDGPRLSPAEFVETMTAILKEVKSVGAMPILVVPPLKQKFALKFTDSTLYADLVRKVAADTQTRCVDARAKFASSEDDTPMLFADFVHPGALGHAWITLLISKELAGMSVRGISFPSSPATELESGYISLKSLQKSAHHRTGIGLKETPAEDVYHLVPEVLAFPIPCRVEWKNFHIPPSSDLHFETSIYTREGISPGQQKVLEKPTQTTAPVEFKIYVARRDSEPELIFYNRRSETNENPFSTPIPARADLKPFAGEDVSIILEASGDVLGCSFGHARVVPYQ